MIGRPRSSDAEVDPRRPHPQAALPGPKPPPLAWAELLVAAPLLTLARILPARVGLGLAGALGMAAYRFNSTWRNVAAVNLDIAFAGELTPGQTRRVTRRAFVSFFQTIAELVHFVEQPPGAVIARTDCDDVENFEAASRARRGVIVCSAHLANWYWPAIYAASLGIPQVVVVEPLANRLLDRRMNRILHRRGITPVPSRGPALRSTVGALQRGEVVGLMVDQNASFGGRFVPFFGIQAATMRGAAYYRRLTGCEVVCVHDVRQEGRHRVTVSRPMDLPDDELGILSRINRYFEDVIRQHPESYFWMQPRWKTRPDGEGALYAGLPF